MDDRPTENNNTSDFRGATISGNSGAIGGGARVTNITAAGADLPQAVDRLVALVRAHHEALAEPEEAADAAEGLQEQAAQARPNQATVRTLLKSLALAAGDVTVVTEAVEHVRRLFGPLAG